MVTWSLLPFPVNASLKLSDVTAAILVPQNNEMADISVSQTNPRGL